jgi:hypothetical protein
VTTDQLAHVLRAAAEIAGDGHILVIGSQAVLATFPDTQLPERVTMSMEADITFLDGDLEKSDLVEGAIGEGSQFHQTFGYFPQGVGLDTAVLPAGWEGRTIRFLVGDSGRLRPCASRFMTSSCQSSWLVARRTTSTPVR